MEEAEAPVESKSEMDLVEKLENDNAEDEDDSSGDDNDNDDEEEDDDDDIPDNGHPSLIQSSSRTNSEKSHHPPKSAALLATGSDVYEFQSSPEDDEAKPAKKFGRVGPSAAKRLKESSPIEEEDSQLQIDDDEDDAETTQQESPKRKVPPLKISLALNLKPTSDEDATQDGETDKGDTETSPKKSARGRKPTTGSNPRLTRSRLKAAEEATPGRRNKPSRRATSSSLIGGPAVDDYDDYLCPGLGVDEDSNDAEPRPESPPETPPLRAYDLVQANTFKGTKGLSALIKDKWKEDLQADLEKSVEEPEIVNYELYMINIKDYFTQNSKYHPPIPKLHPKMDPRLKELYLKQLRERRLRQSEQERERNRLQMYGEHEYLRALRNLVVRERGKLSVMRFMRDAEACNPIPYDVFRPKVQTPSMKPETKEQVLEKINYMANDLLKKHHLANENFRLIQKWEMEKSMQEWEIIAPDATIDNKAVPRVKSIRVDFKYLTEEIKEKNDGEKKEDETPAPTSEEKPLEEGAKEEEPKLQETSKNNEEAVAMDIN